MLGRARGHALALAVALSVSMIPAAAPVPVLAAAATHLQVVAVSPQAAGIAFDVTVTALDGTEAVDTAYAGTVALSGGGASASWNPVISVDQDVIVMAAGQTITFDPLVDRTYGDLPFDVAATATSGLPVSFASTTPPVCTVVGTTVTLVSAGDCIIRASQAGDASYDPAPPVDRTFTVDPAILTPHVTADHKVYDGSTSASILTRTLTGVVGSDDVTLAGGTASFADPDVGPGKTVSVTGLGLAGAAAGSYTLASTSASTSADITPRPLTVTADAKSKVFGEDDPALTFQVTSGVLVAGDAFSGSLARAAGEAAGSYSILQGTLSAGPNYAISYVGASLQIALAGLTVTADDATKTYGSANPALTFTYTGLDEGDPGPATPPTCSTTAVTGSGVGAYPIACGGAADPNYAISYVEGTLNVTPLALTVTADPQTKVYGDADPALGYQVTTGALVGGDSFSGSLARAAGEDVGSRPITQGTLAAGPNYTVAFVGADLAITRRGLTVTANPKSRVYGAANPALDATISGFAFGQTLGTSGVTGSPGLATTATPTSPVLGGPYPISVSLGTLAAANYGFTFVGGFLTVVPAPTAVTLGSSANPGVAGGQVILTATVAGMPSPAGTIDFGVWDGAAFVTLQVATLAGGAASAVTAPIALPASDGEVQYRAVFASTNPDYAGSSGQLVQVVGRSAVSVTLAASRSKWESTVPVSFTATVTPNALGVSLPVTGSVEFVIDGGSPAAIPVVAGSAVLPARLLALGAHQVSATYSGSASFQPGTAAPLSQVVAANVVEATGVGTSGSTIYPYRDTWRDTVTIRGNRIEPLSVAVKIYGPTGRLLSIRTFAAGSGPYAYTWTGRYSSGKMYPAGRYKVVQTATDSSSVPALARSWSSYVTLSTKRMTWTKVSLYKDARAPSAWSGPPSLLRSTRYRTGARLVTPPSPPGWAAFGYSFVLPSATAIKSVAFYVQGGPWSGPTAPKIGLHDWKSGSSWLAMYDATRTRRAVGTSTSSWYGISGDPAAVVRSISGKRYVRGYVDTGGYVNNFRYELGRVRLVVTYGVLR